MVTKKTPRPAHLTEKEVLKYMRALSGWKVNAKSTVLTKSFTFPTFIAGLAYMAKIAVHAEVLEHHPTLELSYGTVKVTLTTHDVKGLTKKDFELAERIDNLRVS